MKREVFLSLPTLGSFDVCVVGAGPAGVCAAVSAAREGAKVALLERFGSVGGNLTLGHIRTCMGGVSAGTMRDELGVLLGTDGLCIPHDTEKAKYTLAAFLEKEGVEVFLCASVCDALVEERRLTSLAVATPQGLCALTAKVSIDATGDGTVAYLAGAPCEFGRVGDHLTQPASILYTIRGVESDLVCTHESDDTILPDGSSYLALCQEAEAAGELPKTVTIVRLYGGATPDERLVNANQLCRIDGTDPKEIARCDLELRRQMDAVTAFLKNRIPGFENITIHHSAELPGFRETRRVMGREMLVAEDIATGRKRPDVLVHDALFCFDTHNPDGGGQAEDLETARAVQPYDIPYGCFLPQKVEGLLTAGRCISGTHKAHSSYRVMNICMAMGEAVGVAAALSVKNACLPTALPVSLVQEVLCKRGVKLFD